jgi:hypothetical protein
VDTFWTLAVRSELAEYGLSEAPDESGGAPPRAWHWVSLCEEVLEKTSCPGGNHHPMEVYPVIIDVEGRAPGLYHYSVRRRALKLLERGGISPDVSAASETARSGSAAFRPPF